MDDRSSGIPIEENLCEGCECQLETPDEKNDGWCIDCSIEEEEVLEPEKNLCKDCECQLETWEEEDEGLCFNCIIDAQENLAEREANHNAIITESLER